METTQFFDQTTLPQSNLEGPNWWPAFDRFQATLTITGAVANIFTLIVLIKSSSRFSRLINILLQHQSFVDGCVCSCAAALILQPYMWMTNNSIGDYIVCHVWHSQAAYWGLVTLSTYNLVLIAFERYLAVCRPFTHTRCTELSRKKIASFGIGLYLFCLALTHGCYLQMKVINGHCLSEYAFSGKTVEAYFFAFVIFTYVTTYLIPALSMALLYAIIAYKLKKRKKNQELGQSRAVDKATDQLTKTAVTVTVIFILTIGYDLHYYLLGYTNVTEYKLNSTEQKIGVFLSNLNSVANPIIYVLLLPVYRKCVADVLCASLRRKKDTQAETDHTASTII